MNERHEHEIVHDTHKRVRIFGRRWSRDRRCSVIMSRLGKQTHNCAHASNKITDNENKRNKSQAKRKGERQNNKKHHEQSKRREKNEKKNNTKWNDLPQRRSRTRKTFSATMVAASMDKAHSRRQPFLDCQISHFVFHMIRLRDRARAHSHKTTAF